MDENNVPGDVRKYLDLDLHEASQSYISPSSLAYTKWASKFLEPGFHIDDFTVHWARWTFLYSFSYYPFGKEKAQGGKNDE